MSKTSSAVKNRWNAKTYKRYTLFLRIDQDAKYIQWIQERRDAGEGLAEIVKACIDKTTENGKK